MLTYEEMRCVFVDGRTEEQQELVRKLDTAFLTAPLHGEDTLLAYVASGAVSAMVNSSPWGLSDAEGQRQVKDLMLNSVLRSDLTKPHALVNALDCCRRILDDAVSAHGNDHPELKKQDRCGLETGDAACGRCGPDVCMQAVLACLGDLASRALGAWEDGKDLPAVYLFRLGTAMLHYEADVAVRTDERPASGRMCEGCSDLVFAMCCRGWPRLAGAGEARRRLCEVLLELLLRHQESATPQLSDEQAQDLLCIFTDDDDAVGRGVQQEGGKDDGSHDQQLPLFLREPGATELLPYRLALLARTLRLSSCKDSIVQCPLYQHYMRISAEGGDEQRSEPPEAPYAPLLDALSDHDDLMMGVMNDLLVAHISGSVLETPVPRPEALFAAFLEAISFDSEVIMEYLVSTETCALEYITRLTRFLTSRNDSSSHEDMVGFGADARVAVAFILELSDKLTSLSSKGLFPYDASPLLKRMGELRRATAHAAKS